MLRGYQVQNMVEVKTTNVGGLGALLDDAVGAAPRVCTAFNFEASDMEAIKAQARDQAMANAQAKAQQLAKDAGCAWPSRRGRRINDRRRDARAARPRTRAGRRSRDDNADSARPAASLDDDPCRLEHHVRAGSRSNSRSSASRALTFVSRSASVC